MDACGFVLKLMAVQTQGEIGSFVTSHLFVWLLFGFFFGVYVHLHVCVFVCVHAHVCWIHSQIHLH